MAAAFVQGTRTVAAGPLTVIAATYASPVTIGSDMLVGVGWRDVNGASMTISSIVDSGGHTWTTNPLQWAGGAATRAIQTFTARNLSTAAHTVTITFSAAVDDAAGVYVVEMSGTASTGMFIDDSVGSQSSGSSVAGGDVITTADSAFLFTLVINSASRTYSPPTGYTVIGATSTRVRAAYRIAGGADTYSATWNWTGGDAGALAIHEAYRAEPPVVAATHIPFNLVNTRAFNHGLQL